ncbi:MAG: hypothetical protein FJ138_03290 [Deltaproteobacteria bacterium]|jgi:uncharacterized protein YbaR (Trm112 family)|nr:hypothetical protein [Deltaproteobacteria bacterium]
MLSHSPAAPLLPERALSALRCPQRRQPLRVLSAEGWATLKARLPSAQVTTGFGAQITAEGGAICEDHTPEGAPYFYPIAEGLMYLMPSDAVRVTG